MVLDFAFVCQCEKASCKEPLGKHVPGGVADKYVVRDMTNHVLALLMIGCTSVFCSTLVPENEVSESEFLFDIVGQLEEKCPRVFL